MSTSTIARPTIAEPTPAVALTPEQEDALLLQAVPFSAPAKVPGGTPRENRAWSLGGNVD